VLCSSYVQAHRQALNRPGGTIGKKKGSGKGRSVLRSRALAGQRQHHYHFARVPKRMLAV